MFLDASFDLVMLVSAVVIALSSLVIAYALLKRQIVGRRNKVESICECGVRWHACINDMGGISLDSQTVRRNKC